MGEAASEVGRAESEARDDKRTELDVGRRIYEKLTEVRPGPDVRLDPPGTHDDMEMGTITSIIGASNDYLVFVDAQAQVRFTALDANHNQRHPRFSRNWTRVQRLQESLGLLEATHTTQQIHSLRRLLGTVVQSGLQGDHNAMEDGLNRVECNIFAQVSNNARQIYVTTAIATSVVAGLVTALGFMVTWTLALTDVGGPAELEQAELVLSGLLGGAVGALMSTLLSINKDMSFDPHATVEYARFEARIRMLVGILAGVVVVICFASGLLSSAALEGSGLAGMFVVATIAGFTERFVPNILVGQSLSIHGPSHPSKTGTSN